MRMNHGLLFWGLGFLSAGLVALAIQQNYLDRETMSNAWHLWPLILVAIGLALVLSRTPYALVGTALSAIVIGVIVGTAITLGPGVAVSCGSGPTPDDLTSHTGSFGAQASLDWQMNCGNLDVTMSGGSTWSASVGNANGSDPTVDGTADGLRLASVDQGGDIFKDRSERWIVTLPTGTTYGADIHANAGKVTLNLDGARFDGLSIQPNAADVHLSLEDASISDLHLQLNVGSTKVSASTGTSLSGRIQMNVGSVDLCVPEAAAIRITTSGTIFGTNLDQSGLTRRGDTWESASYAGAERQITLEVQGNVGSFNLNPSGGC